MMMEESGSSDWAWEQDKAFESALALHPDDDDDSEGDRWERIAALVTGKSAEEVKRHYHILIQDVEAIESGQVLLPNYNYASSSSSSLPDGGGGGDAVGEGGGKKSTGNSAVSRSEQERRKGIAWTEEEHRLFLLGLDKYGKGDWRSISRNFVITRTPTQVASHAQKYFIRLQSINKDRRRTSIHDITSVGNSDISSPQAPITGQANGVVTTPTSQASQMPIASGMYGGTHIGQPIISRPLISAVGTPVNMPAPGHMVYGVRAPVTGPSVSGPSSLNFPTTSYPLQQQQQQQSSTNR